MKRLPPQPGEAIDRQRPLGFAFEGRPLQGYAGDTIASALAGAGERVVGRSFKYHRPRGLLSAAGHDVNALFQVDHAGRSLPNVRGDTTLLADGMSIRAVNTFGGLRHDRARFIGWLAPLLPVGFYYKAFHSRRGFPRWERMFRALTGLGAVDRTAPVVKTPKRYDFCDVLVVGAGAAGLSAAIAAAEAGAQVLLVDEQVQPGGSLQSTPPVAGHGGLPAGAFGPAGPAGSGRGAAAAASIAFDGAEVLQRLIAQATALPNLRVSTRTCAVGAYADRWIALATPTHVVKVRSGALVVAQGAYEQPAVFRHNDLPGVMLASGARGLMRRYAVAPCSRVVLLVANVDGYAAAFDALAHGIEVAAVLDLRADPGPLSAPLARALVQRGVHVVRGAAIHEARAAADGTLGEVLWGELRGDGTVDAGALQRIDCDGLWMSVGWAGATGLLAQAGVPARFDETVQQFLPDAAVARAGGLFACGRVNGVHGVAERLADGAVAGRAAAAWAAGGVNGDATAGTDAVSALALAGALLECRSHPFPVFAHPRGKDFVDFDEDLQVRDLLNAAQEGFDSIELLKRYSTVGMGPSQGKHSNVNAARILARHLGDSVGATGLSTARPLHHPVPMALLAGRGFAVERATPLRDAHDAAGAVWMPAGNWQRPEYYAREGAARAACIAAEVAAVRTAVGLIDVGTLGKIEVHGPDAAQFLERVYTGRFAGLAVGATRYGVMCDEAGVLIDDGVVARLGADHFYFTTTTGGSATVYRELTRWNTLWGLEVGVVNLTGHLAALNLAGPRAREVLARLTPLDLGEAAFPYLGCRQALVAGAPARLLRVGFVGELGYEIHVPFHSACAVWQALLAAGGAHGIRPFGVEAQRLLRLEKGHLIVGQDTDGLTDPIEAGCAWAVKMDKPFFVGQRSLRILAGRPRRQQLVGFELAGDERAPRPQECHLVIDGAALAGRVTSCAWSATLGRAIGLALVRPEVAARGRFTIRIGAGVLREATVVPTPFYDAGNARQKPAEAG